jgi:hypothetical protein
MRGAHRPSQHCASAGVVWVNASSPPPSLVSIRTKQRGGSVRPLRPLTARVCARRGFTAARCGRIPPRATGSTRRKLCTLVE